MNLDQFEIILAIVEYGGFREASKKLHKSQSTLSISIKNLEDELNVKIFERTKKNSIITPVGKLILKEASRALNASNTIKRIGLDLGNNKFEEKLTINIDPSIPENILKRIVELVGQLSPSTNLVLKTFFMGKPEVELLKESIDLSISPFITNYDETEQFPIYEINLMTVISKKLLGKNTKNISASLLTIPQVLVFQEQDQNQDQNQGLNTIEFYEINSPKILVTSHEIKLKLIKAGAGWGRIFPSEFEQLQDSSLIEVKDIPMNKLVYPVYLHRKRKKTQGALATFIWDTLSIETNIVKLGLRE